jgi:GNAT superfamily N-acetyltransferase
MFEIRQATQLSPEETQRLFGWNDNIFATAHLNLIYRPKDGIVRFVLDNGAEGPLSHAAILKHQAIANALPALIGGIGGVVTIPEAQRRGYATSLVRHATAFLRDDWQVDLALLFCIDRMVGFYQRLGWRQLSCDVLIDQPSGKIPCPFHVMTLGFKPQFDKVHSIELGSAPW